MLSQPKTYIKAIYGAAVAFLGALGTAMTDSTVTGQEWIVIATGTILAAGGVFGLRNRDATPKDTYQGKHEA